MEIECVVCGSQNDLRALRCFVCGAELPPTSVGVDHYDSTLNSSSLQGLHASVKTPLSVGALPLEEMLSKRPHDLQLNEQQISASNVNILLEPEELSPLTNSSIEREKYERQAAQNSKSNASLSDSADDISLLEDIPDLETQQRLEAEAQDRSDSTWIGVPIPESKKDSKTYNDFEQARLEQRLKSRKDKPDSHESSPYTPISSLLEMHQRNDSPENESERVIIPRENTLTGEELKSIAADVLPNPWTPIEEQSQSYKSQDQNLDNQKSSSDEIKSEESSKPISFGDSEEPLVVDAPQAPSVIGEEEEQETALRVSIPELLAVAEPIAEVDTSKNFVPITSMSYPHENEEEEAENSPSEVDLSFNNLDQIQNKFSEAPKQALNHSIHSEELPTQNFDQSKSYGLSGFMPELVEENTGFSPFSWFLLALSSLSVGVVIALYLMPHGEVGIEARLQVTQITRGEGKYRVNLKAFAKPEANLIIPDSYLSLGQSPLTVVKGSATVSIEVPEDQVTVGQNQVTLQWAYASGGEQPQRFSPVDIYIPVIHKQGEVSFSPERQAYLLGIELSSGQNLVDSEQAFELAKKKNHYHFVLPKAAVNKQQTISFKAQVEDAQQTKTELRLSYLLPQSSEPLVIQSPVKRYARPDRTLSIQGRTTPLAQVSISSLKKNGTPVKLPTTAVKVAQDGSFALPLKFDKNSKRKEGDLWTVELVSVDQSGLSQSQSIELKQSYAPTWRRYVKRLKSRRDRAKSRYRQFSYKRLNAKLAEYEGKAGMISGRVAFIDRGNDQKSQRFLIHTCPKNKCPIWVEDQNAFWIKVGQEVSIFAVVSGADTFQVASGADLKAPLLRSRLTTP